MAAGRLFLCSVCSLVLLISAGCARVQPAAAPAELLRLSPGWQALAVHHQNTLEPLLREALAANPDYQQQLARLAEQAAALRLSRAERLPGLDAELSVSRSRTPVGATRVEQSQAQLALSLGWDPDLWGRLSAAQREAAYRYAAQRARVQDSQARLAEQLLSLWLAVQAADLSTQLRREQRDTLQQNLEIIDSGYKLGLNSALDLYLARSDLANADAQLTTAEQARSQQVRELQRLLGRYPDGNWPASEQLVDLLPAAPPATSATQRLMHRADLNAAWLEVAAADAGAASAYKSRFPQLRLSASLSDTAQTLSTAGEGPLSWNLLAGLTQPVLDGGALKAREQSRRAQAQQVSYQFQQTLLQAAQEVVAGLDDELQLSRRQRALQTAARDARAAQALAFEQYQRGLVAYTTVLEAQRRAINARISLLELRLALQQNRLKLFRALAAPESLLAVSRS